MAPQQEYFTSEKKGETYELRQELRNDKKDKRKEALKRIINYMTTGKDMSELFMDVVNLIQTDNLELKKLVYLYLTNYSRSHPELALLAVNTFLRDCDDPNPLVRSMAVRAMGCIRVENISEYLCAPLIKCLKDSDPYVRKTSAICVLKLYNINPELVFEHNFVFELKEMLSDSNSMVLTNALSALIEMTHQSSNPDAIFTMNIQLVNKFLSAMNECTEWGQIVILEALSMYTPKNVTEAQNICERITSRLSHANSALVLSTVKVLLMDIPYLDPNDATKGRVFRKMGPPLITMLTAEPEIQYVVLRNLNLISQKYPEILRNDYKSFFVKYNDPIYVKLEKLEIMIKLIDNNNIFDVLNELKEYATEVDVDFVRRAVRCIGTCALKVESAADQCVAILVELIQSNVAYIVQESVIVTMDIMRKFPNKYESVIGKLGENMLCLDQPESRAAFIWIIGEYGDRIDNAPELLNSFVSSFLDENPLVQLQIITASVKIFLRRPTEAQEILNVVLGLATEQNDNPDVRDRGFIYWRLLSSDPSTAKEVVLAKKPPISTHMNRLDECIDQLLMNMSTLSSIYHKLPDSISENGVCKRTLNDKKAPISNDNADLLMMGSQTTNVKAPTNLIDQLLDFDFSTNVAPVSTVQPIDIFNDSLLNNTTNRLDEITNLFSDMSIPFTSEKVTHQTTLNSYQDLYYPPSGIWLNSNAAKGMEVVGQFNSFSLNGISATLSITNRAMGPISNISIQLNTNYFGLKLASMPVFTQVIPPSQSMNVNLEFVFGDAPCLSNPNVDKLQLAFQNNIDVFFCFVTFPFHFYFKTASDPLYNSSHYTTTFNSLQKSHQPSEIFKPFNKDQIKRILRSLRISVIDLDQPNAIIGWCCLNNNKEAYILIELAISSTIVTTKSLASEIVLPIQSLISSTLEQNYY